MIFVTVGSSERGIEFDRLIKEMDRIAGMIGRPVCMQIGSSRYVPRHAEYFSYKLFDDMLTCYQRAELVVGHCGAGTVLNALRYGVPFIAVPRTHALGEVDRDDHQAVLARKIESIDRVRIVYQIEDLEKAVREMLKNKGAFSRAYFSEARASLLTCLIDYITEVSQC